MNIYLVHMLSHTYLPLLQSLTLWLSSYCLHKLQKNLPVGLPDQKLSSRPPTPFTQIFFAAALEISYRIRWMTVFLATLSRIILVDESPCCIVIYMLYSLCFLPVLTYTCSLSYSSYHVVIANLPVL